MINPNLGKTTNTDEFRRALHLSKLIPLGRKDDAKKKAVNNWNDAMQKALAVGRN